MIKLTSPKVYAVYVCKTELFTLKEINIWNLLLNVTLNNNIALILFKNEKIQEVLNSFMNNTIRFALDNFNDGLYIKYKKAINMTDIYNKYTDLKYSKTVISYLYWSNFELYLPFDKMSFKYLIRDKSTSLLATYSVIKTIINPCLIL